MVVQVFSILDAKTGAFGQPFFAFNAAVAQRTVAAVLMQGDSLVGKFPQDYQLFHIGRFDDASGELMAIAPVSVCNVASLKEVVHAS
ncbi:MAG: nonstructural protein [Microviridae sp.]|nr:MAG: nonstructural protein [Microviridae sp.]